MAILSGAELEQAIGTLSGWTLERGELVQQWTFKDFPAAIHFVNQVAPLAEDAGHHPDIDIRRRDHGARYLYGKTDFRNYSILKTWLLGDSYSEYLSVYK
jgi:hypothetical protein